MKNVERSGSPSCCTFGGWAAIICAEEDEGFSGLELLARAIANRPPNEGRLRGLC